jgi:hypothetical protein
MPKYGETGDCSAHNGETNYSQMTDLPEIESIGLFCIVASAQRMAAL